MYMWIHLAFASYLKRHSKTHEKEQLAFLKNMFLAAQK